MLTCFIGDSGGGIDVSKSAFNAYQYRNDSNNDSNNDSGSDNGSSSDDGSSDEGSSDNDGSNDVSNSNGSDSSMIVIKVDSTSKNRSVGCPCRSKKTSLA